MYCISKNEKKEIINEYNNIKCSHVLICMNKYSGNIFPWYVTYDNDIIKIIEQCNYHDSDIEILEIYDVCGLLYHLYVFGLYIRINHFCIHH